MCFVETLSKREVGPLAVTSKANCGLSKVASMTYTQTQTYTHTNTGRETHTHRQTHRHITSKADFGLIKVASSSLYQNPPPHVNGDFMEEGEEKFCFDINPPSKTEHIR